MDTIGNPYFAYGNIPWITEENQVNFTYMELCVSISIILEFLNLLNSVKWTKYFWQVGAGIKPLRSYSFDQILHFLYIVEQSKHITTSQGLLYLIFRLKITLWPLKQKDHHKIFIYIYSLFLWEINFIGLFFAVIGHS